MKKIIQRQAPELPALSSLHPILQRIYASRGIVSLEELERQCQHLLPFHSLKDIDKATDLLADALLKQSHIMIIGDYDVDGATSTALAIRALRQFGAKHVTYFVPDRFELGYGLSPELVELVADAKPDILVTVDNGIASIEGVAAANALGMKVLVTDHHLAGDILPDAAAIINPNQPGDAFPSKNLAGVGVIFYVMSALRAKLRSLDYFSQHHIAEFSMASFLDLVALGTVADLVPLDRNNRILVYQGLQRIRQGRCVPGITALLEIANRNIAKMVSSDLGFAVGPRLNAAGRLEDMSVGIECLLTDNMEKAREFSVQLDQLNQERRNIEQDMKREANDLLNALHLSGNLPIGLCLFEENWHQGVVGILAGRLKDQFNRPAIAFAAENDLMLKGSARSIKGLHLRDLLADIAAQHPGLMGKFGGHAMAAGLSLPRENFDAFKKIFEARLSERLTADDLEAKLLSDGVLPAEAFGLDLAEQLAAAGPWGQTFPEPVFDGVFEVLSQRIVGEKHLKLSLKQGGQVIDAIAFFVDTNVWPQHRCKDIRIVYKLDINEYLGRRTVQLIVDYIEPMRVAENASQAML